MCHLPKFEDPNLLIGFDTSDDAAVYKIDDNTAMIQSVDIFPPVVDNPYMYGAIAAANSLSDIYAMGGSPRLAMNVLCIPEDLDINVTEQILRGGYDKVKEAGAVICGGHTIKDPEPKYGLCVTGFAHPDKIWANHTAKPGEVLILTKPLGTGILNTALKAELLQPETEKIMMESMAELNKYPAEIISGFPVSACTDITGFGLLGHCFEMAKGSGTTITVEAESVPLLPEARDMAKMGIIPRGAYANRKWLLCSTQIMHMIPLDLQDVLFDPQTSGGLLFSIAEEYADECLSALKEKVPCATVIGKVNEYDGKYIRMV